MYLLNQSLDNNVIRWNMFAYLELSSTFFIELVMNILKSLKGESLVDKK